MSDKKSDLKHPYAILMGIFTAVSFLITVAAGWPYLHDLLVSPYILSDGLNLEQRIIWDPDQKKFIYKQSQHGAGQIAIIENPEYKARTLHCTFEEDNDSKEKEDPIILVNNDGSPGGTLFTQSQVNGSKSEHFVELKFLQIGAEDRLPILFFTDGKLHKPEVNAFLVTGKENQLKEGNAFMILSSVTTGLSSLGGFIFGAFVTYCFLFLYFRSTSEKKESG